MALDNKINKVYDSNLSCSNDDDEINYLYHELYDSLVKEKKDLKSKIAKNDMLHEKIKQFEKENHVLNMLVKQLLSKNKVCYEFEAYKAKNHQLSSALQKFTNNKNARKLVEFPQ